MLLGGTEVRTLKKTVPDNTLPDILVLLEDLYKQAITEHTHNYTANLLARAMVEISMLRAELQSCQWWNQHGCPKAKL